VNYGLRDLKRNLPRVVNNGLKDLKKNLPRVTNYGIKDLTLLLEMIGLTEHQETRGGFGRRLGGRSG
jgi:hypothetical protein